MTSFTFDYLNLMLAGAETIVVSKGVNLIKCNLCDWDVRIRLPCLHQLSSFEDIKQIWGLVKRRWEKTTYIIATGLFIITGIFIWRIVIYYQ